MPQDTSPHGGEAMHPLPDRAKIPQPRPGADGDVGGQPKADPSGDIANRPSLPDHPEVMGADTEDAPPAAGGTYETGKPSVTRQPGN